jgi:predicted SnoaL-like aldol condensation-catalyzing enzyme
VLTDPTETKRVFPVVGLRRSGFPRIDFEIVRMFQDGSATFIQAAHMSGAREAAWGSMSLISKPSDRHPDGLCRQITVTSADRSQPDQTMSRGSRNACDLEHTFQNKALAEEFTRTVMLDRQYHRLSDYLCKRDFVSHNARIGPNFEAMQAFLDAQETSQKLFEYTELIEVVGKGNFVAVFCSLDFRGEPHNACDLYRLDAGRIVEHWDVAERVARVPRPSNDKFS